MVKRKKSMAKCKKAGGPGFVQTISVLASGV